jgi:diguanylate cyclase (GGDEF)-like protein/PAS domain S-box-containing protein
MKTPDVIHLLIINESQNEAETITNLFRNDGNPARTERPASADELEHLLADTQWDLLIADGLHPDIDLKQLKSLLKQIKEDIPVLLLTRSANQANNIDHAMELGVEDVIYRDQEDWLLHVAMREIKNRRIRKQNKQLGNNFNELQARYDLVLEGSNDAIAYVIDGMHINVNEAYAEHFGYENPDDLAVIPLIDLIADDKQVEFKKFLKSYAKSQSQEASLDTTGTAADGSSVPMSMDFSPASYEQEDCTQVVIRAEANAASTSAVDADSGHFLNQLKHYVAQTKAKETAGALICIQPWNFWKTRQGLGLFISGEVLEQMGELTAKNLDGRGAIGRVGGDFFVIAVPDIHVDEALELAEKLCKKIEDHLFEINHTTARLQAKAGVVVFDKNTPEAAEIVIDYAFHGLAKFVDNETDKLAILYQPPAEPVDLYSGDIDLNELVEQGKLNMMFQPMVSLKGAEGEYYEVMTSITDENDEPVKTYKVAETMLSKADGSGFDRWLLFSAIKRLAIQRKTGNDTRLILNITPSALRDADFANWAANAINAAGLKPGTLVIQLEEGPATNYLKLAANLFENLRKAECDVSLANFGINESAMKTMAALKVKMVKINYFAATGQKTPDGDTFDLKEILADVNKIDGTAFVPGVSQAADMAKLWQYGAAFIQGEYLQGPRLEMNYEFSDMS